METIPLTDAQKRGLSVNPAPEPKVRLRFGARCPLFPNALIAVAYVPATVAHQLTDAVATIRTVGGAFYPQFAAALVCEAS